MDQIRQLYERLTPRQRLYLAGAALAVVGLIYALVLWQKQRDFKPLYTGLAPQDAGAVTARLRERNVEFQLDEGGSTVLVPSGKVDEARLDLAAAGLPKTGRIGYELFDKVSFGVTDFAEQVNYHRALEGELERSMMGLAEVESARVHVTFPKESVFAESRQPAKASVMLKLKHGRRLAQAHVEAIQHLTASAVEGLDPQAVAVLDMRGQLLSRGQGGAPSEAERSEAFAEQRRKMEADLLAKVQQTLEPLLGAERFRAGVSVEFDLSSGEQSEETFDPGKSVMVTQQRSEETAAPQTPGGVPGTPSTLPRPTGRPFGAGANVARRTENVTFQSSRAVRKTSTPQGVLKRLSLSILVDQRVRWEGAGAKAKRIIEPPKAEELKAIRDVVAGAVGFNAGRGDQVFVESLAFEATLNATPPVAATTALPPGSLLALLPEALRSPMALAILAGAACLLLVAVLGLAWLVLRKKKAKKAAQAATATAAIEGSAGDLAALAAAAGGEASTGAAAGAAGGGEMGGKDGGGADQGAGGTRGELTAPSALTVEQLLADKELERERFEQQELARLQAATMSTTKTDILTRHISEEAKKNPEAIAQVLRTWLEESR